MKQQLREERGQGKGAGQGRGVPCLGAPGRPGVQPGNGYVRMAVDLIACRYPRRRVTFVNTGIGGNTVRDLLNRCGDDVIARPPNIRPHAGTDKRTAGQAGRGTRTGPRTERNKRAGRGAPQSRPALDALNLCPRWRRAPPGARGPSGPRRLSAAGAYGSKAK